MNTPATPAFLDGEIKGQKREVRLAEVCRVGRSVTNDLVLDEESVSRNHALVYASEAGVYYINDLGSSNGTFVNGSRVSAPTQLRNGDRVLFGTCGLEFRQQQAPQPKPVRSPTLAATNVFFAQKLITVLVVDIRGFTVLAQRLDPDTLPKITGALFREAGRVLKERGAWGQKYIGDAVMAVWLHSGSIENEMADVLAALASLADIAGGLQAKLGLADPIRIGAGLNSGLASLGNAGSATAPDFTALGDTVNKAFRLETATKEVGWDVLLGVQTYELIASLGPVQRVLQTRAVQLKGYAEPVTAWGARFQEFLPAVAALRPDASRTGHEARDRSQKEERT